MRALAILAITCFILAQVLNLAGYAEAVVSGEITLLGLVIFERVSVMELLFSMFVFWPIVRQRNWIAPILLIVFILIPVYHLYDNLMYWYVHEASFYSQFPPLIGARIFVGNFVLAFGLPYVVFWFQNRISSTDNKAINADV